MGRGRAGRRGVAGGPSGAAGGAGPGPVAEAHPPGRTAAGDRLGAGGKGHGRRGGGRGAAVPGAGLALAECCPVPRGGLPLRRAPSLAFQLAGSYASHFEPSSGSERSFCLPNRKVVPSAPLRGVGSRRCGASRSPGPLLPETPCRQLRERHCSARRPSGRPARRHREEGSGGGGRLHFRRGGMCGETRDIQFRC